MNTPNVISTPAGKCPFRLDKNATDEMILDWCSKVLEYGLNKNPGQRYTTKALCYWLTNDVWYGVDEQRLNDAKAYIKSSVNSPEPITRL